MAHAPPIDGRLPGRVPPHDLEAEMSVLGAMLLDELAIIKVSEFLRPGDFYRKNHEDIYRASLELLSQGEPIDIVTVGSELEKMGVLERVGGRAYLAQLEQAVPTSANIEYYGRIVKEKATKRQLISAGGDISGLGYDDAIEAPDALNLAQKVVFDISEDRLQTDFEKLFGLLRTTMERVDALQNNTSGTVGVASGFYDLDAKTNGFKTNELTIVAGRPSMGKCVSFDTLLDDPLTGERVTAEQWVAQRRPMTWSLSEEGRLGPASVGAWVDSGVKPVHRVTTRTGRSVEVTGHHPFLTVDGWQPLHDLEVGDSIAVPRTLPSFGSVHPDARSVRLLAYFIAEGGLTQGSPSFTNTDPKLIDDFERIVTDLYPSLGFRRHRITRYLTSGRRGGKPNPVTLWLRELGLWGKRAEDKQLPAEVWRWDRRTLAEFLSVLFSCDGTIYRMGGYPRIEFTVASHHLAEDVHHALCRFGIVAKLWRKTERSWRVEITEPRSVWRYQAEIGWYGEKDRRFGTQLEEPARRSNVGVLPNSVWSKVRDAAAEPSMSLLDVARAAGETGARGRGFNPHSNRGVPQSRLAAYAAVLDAPGLALLASEDIYWDTIVSIRAVGEKHVYDLNVPHGSNFVAQDIYVHNTSLALNIALEAATRDKVGVAIFSLEMSKDQLAERLLCEYARVDAQRLHRGLLGEAEHERLAQALGPLGEAPIFIDDSPMLDELMLLTKARRIKLQEQIGMIIVDYLQLMHSRRGGSDDNRVQEVSQISRSMKALARELKVPVIALSQLSRGPEQRTDKRPMLSDLRESGCLTGDSRVYLPSGAGYKSMRELAGTSGFDVLAMNPATWKLEPRTVQAAFSTGVKPVFRLTTALGRTIRATANHKFLAFDGWKCLDELQPSDFIALPRTLPAAQIRTMTDPELALLGHLIGDGCTLPRHVIQYTTREPDLAELVAGLARRLFPQSVIPRINAERAWYQVYLPSAVRLSAGNRNPISAWLDRLGVFGLRSHEKHVPDTVFEQPASGIATFLRHLWATDGCIHAGTPNRPQPTIYYATSSNRLAIGVQSLLLRLGINASVSQVPQRKGRDQFHVMVSGRPDMVSFLKVVGAVDGRRAEAAAIIGAYFSARIGNPNRDVVPAAAWRRLAQPAARRGGVTSRGLALAINTAYSGTSLYKQNMSRDRAGRVAVAVGSSELGLLAAGDAYWDRVVAIVPDGEEETFDLTVEGLHNFVADDIVVHNSIEQDADVVIFLYREGYYNKADTTGIAEVIVAKNRNGPTGTVNLRFRPELTRFENLDMRRRAPDDGGVPADT